MRPSSIIPVRPRRVHAVLAFICLFPAASLSQTPGQATDARVRGLTTVAGIAVGHHTLDEQTTGCTVILTESGATAGVDVRGAAPGTRDTDLLNPVNTVDEVHAIVLGGGSAFGLSAADGVMKFLEERGVGFPMRAGRVPIVPAAILYDLPVGSNARVRPTADCGYRAASAATVGPIAEGNVGAGAGATIGKLYGHERAMKGGLGTSAFSLPNGIIVAALVAVNGVGDVVDPADGKVVAGVRTTDGKKLADVRTMIRAGGTLSATSGESTTLGVVATNARLTKAQATRLAQMAQDGIARAVVPAHTPYDGDTIFAVATGTRNQPVDPAVLGALAADAVADAIVRAARAATGIPGYPAARDLAAKPPR
jgi:L-aminopeptidase/D-esterase-like protein